MKKLVSILFLSGCLLYQAHAQDLRMPAPSPSSEIKQEFALSSVEVSYSRPSMKGRTIFGDLVPYGKVWRTGANQATTITFGEDVTVGGKPVKAGKYGLLTIPNTTEWTVIITKQLDVTSPAAYKEAEDVARFTVPVENLPVTVETFMITFDNISSSEMNMLLLWDKAVVAVPIKAEVDSKVMAQIDQLMNKDNKPYFMAGMYYLQTGKDLNKSLEWFDKAIQQNPDGFWIYHQKANAQAKLGKKKEALETAQKSIELAKKAKNDDYVALNEKLIKTLK
jgi:hypothetical protein